jgi:hypothetical protein
MWLNITIAIVGLLVMIPITCIVHRWIFRVNEGIELQKQINKKLGELVKAADDDLSHLR